jgi:2-polyprenyl-3-methyl-5-hydroxy-6-metoxy-1,4-benzoquinol methylase
MATLTIHHFPADQALAALTEMVRVSAGLVVVSELERSLPHYLGAQVLAHTVWANNPITRHDAPASVRAGFTRTELEQMGRAAGLIRPRVTWTLPFRITLRGWAGDP